MLIFIRRRKQFISQKIELNSRDNIEPMNTLVFHVNSSLMGFGWHFLKTQISNLQPSMSFVFSYNIIYIWTKKVFIFNLTSAINCYGSFDFVILKLFAAIRRTVSFKTHTHTQKTQRQRRRTKCEATMSLIFRRMKQRRDSRYRRFQCIVGRLWFYVLMLLLFSSSSSTSSSNCFPFLYLNLSLERNISSKFVPLHALAIN